MIRVFRPLSLALELEPGSAPYRPLIFEPGRVYYHARRFVQYNDAEFWAYKRDLEFVGVFVEERIDREGRFRGAVFMLDDAPHFVEYIDSGTCFARTYRKKKVSRPV
jgi:hypothetical protein